MRLLFLVPVYNHPLKIGRVAVNCLAHGFDVLLVDDGSNEETKRAIAEAAKRSPDVHVLTLPENGGKGAAVLAGFRWAIERGYTHAFQLDADLQQDPAAIAPFIAKATERPAHVICGYPVYNSSVPRARKWGRNVTHFWVAVNTLSFAIRDSLCGFRIYPLDAVAAWLATSPTVGLRMDFDTDVVVQLYRRGVDVTNLPVGVDYPEDGISHFHGIENWRISKMHARNFITMLPQIPKLVMRHFR